MKSFFPFVQNFPPGYWESGMDLGNRLCLCNSTGPSALLWKWRRVCCLWTFFCLKDFDIWWKFSSNVETIKWSSSAKFSTIRNMQKKNLQIGFVKCIFEFAMVVFLLTNSTSEGMMHWFWKYPQIFVLKRSLYKYCFKFVRLPSLLHFTFVLTIEVLLLH